MVVFSKITSNNCLFHNVMTGMTEIRVPYDSIFPPLFLAMAKGICSVCCDAEAPV